MVSHHLALAVLLAVSPILSAQAPEKKPADFEVRLPEDAVLEVDGNKTQATGETRQFQSRPLEVGGTYSYTLKATWRGKSVTREILLRPGKLTTIDLREALQAAQAPAGSGAERPQTPGSSASIGLEAPGTLTLQAGEKGELRVRVRRTNYKGTIALRLQRLPEGVTAGAATVAADGDEAAIGLTTSADARESTRDVELIGSGEQVVTRTTIRLVVAKAKAVEVEKKQAAPPVSTRVETKPPSLPVQPSQRSVVTAPKLPAEAGLQLLLEPSDLVLTQGESRAVHVQVRPKGSWRLDGAPDVKVEAGPGAGVQFTVWASSIAPDGTSYTKTFALRAPTDAPEGERTVRVVATAGSHSSSTASKVTIKKAPPPPAVETKPAPQLVVAVEPAELTLAPGQTRTVAVRVAPVGAAALVGTPTVKVSGEQEGVKLTPWSSSLAGDRSSYEKVYAVRVAADAAPAQHRVRVMVEGGSRQATATLKVTVGKAEP